MRILALEPYCGGSHQAFLDGWRAVSRHEWTVLGLPAHHWKWRMRHAAVTFAEDLRRRAAAGERWDVVFCSDMLNLAELLGLARDVLAGTPAVAYFHENQLAYPVRHEDQRDVHFGLSNLLTALAATEVWFNSAFHRDAFLSAAEDLLAQMPDHPLPSSVRAVRQRGVIQPPGVADIPLRGPRRGGPLRVCWAARWEHDKNPELFFDAMELLRGQQIPFRLNVLGQGFRDVPPVFTWAKEFFAGSIDRWGYAESRAEYERALLRSDVFVSTAEHEFFGLAAVEAARAGAQPLLPRRLAYPEVFAGLPEPERHFYDGSAEMLADLLADLAAEVDSDCFRRRSAGVRRAVERFTWPVRGPELDEAIERAV